MWELLGSTKQGGVMKRWWRRWALWFLVPALAVAGEIPREEVSNLYYGSWKMPSQLSPARLEKLINQTAQTIHGKGFRYIGVDEDWFHGHVLMENLGTKGSPRFFPRAILYHTQEEAYAVHWRKEKDPKYDYLNVATRNWIQWLSDEPYFDGFPVENAKAYVDERQRDPRQFETEFAEPDPKLHYTIHGRTLDPAKLNFVVAAELQFEFYLAECTTNGVIQVAFPNGESHCLKLGTMNPLYENDPPKPLHLAGF